ncbi:MAG: 2-hydroxyacid dehydrogenase [Paracoccaceae bacterium]
MTRILLTRQFPEATVAAAKALGDVTVRPVAAPLQIAEAAEALANYDAIICTLGDDFSDPAFATDSIRCKIIANFGVGYNHIDAGAAKAAGVTVSNTPDTVTDATADIALTLMLMTCRRASEGERFARAGLWEGWQPTQMLGMHMTGKRLGIVGMGRIGQAVAQRGHFGFGMPVIYYNRSRKDVDMPARQVDDLESLMSQADVIVVTVPGGPETHHLIDAAALAQMDDGSVIVNVSRGDVVDEAALIAELETGRIKAGLDVYEAEPFIPEALRVLDNVTLLPHLGTAALDVREAMGQMAVDNVAAVLQDEAAPNAV